MRGSDKLKKIYAYNTDVKSILVKSMLLYNGLVGILYWHKGKSLFLFLFCTAFEILAVALLFKFTKPKIVLENGMEKLVDVSPINSSGILSFCWDILFWSMLGKFLVPFNLKWFSLYLGIPASFFLEFLYKPYKKLKGS